MSDRLSDWVSVVPGKDNVKATARALLDLAGDPRDVRTLGNGDEFLVPPSLAAAFDAVSAPAPAAKPPRKPRAKKEESS